PRPLPPPRPRIALPPALGGGCSRIAAYPCVGVQPSCPHPRRADLRRMGLTRCDRLQMPNTINATNPMPTNSTTSATESYSSQCRLPESMMFHPCFKWTARIGRQLHTRSSGDLPPPPPADEGPPWPPCHALVLRHDRNGLARNHREQQKESQLRDI